MMTYMTSLGEFNNEEFAENGNAFYLFWGYWIVISILTLIVMLNLLIAIVSKTFENVLETAIESNYLEQCKTLRDMQFV